MSQIPSNDDEIEFLAFIKNVVSKTGLNSGLSKMCFEKENILLFRQAFISPTMQREKNYELFEQLGDVTINKFIVQHMYDSFPQLKTADGVNVVARLKIYYGGKKFIQLFAENLKLWQFVVASDDEKMKKKKNLTEDVFEALVGVLEFVVGRVISKVYGQYGKACGFHMAYNFLTFMYRDVCLKISYEMLVDPKTRLKELFDERKNDLGPLVFYDSRNPETAEYKTEIRSKTRVIGAAASIVKKDAHEQASQRALENLAKLRIVKRAPLHYETFREQGTCRYRHGQDLVQFISTFLHFSSLPEKWIQHCISPDSLVIFSTALTSKSIDPLCNYEFLEQLGDASINKFIVQYMYDRYPHLTNSFGVNVVARLKIKYGSKGQLNKLAERLLFWNMVKATDEERNKRKKSLLEDVFEAFIGCVEYVLDEAARHDKKEKTFGFGYHYVYEILSSIFDKLDIPFAYEKLVDNKTRLKELFDENKGILGNLSYDDFRCAESGLYISRAKNDDKVLAFGTSTLKKDAQEKASENALKTLSKRGITKIVPAQYREVSAEPQTHF
jgi:dsRNA-specific ribonuclease